MPVKPSDKEEEYFLRLEAEKMKKAAEAREQKIAEAKREELKKLHWMQCPKCGMELQTISYRSVEIDRCFSCNGVWLDVGELEKIAAEIPKSGTLSGILRVFK